VHGQFRRHAPDHPRARHHHAPRPELVQPLHACARPQHTAQFRVVRTRHHNYSQALVPSRLNKHEPRTKTYAACLHDEGRLFLHVANWLPGWRELNNTQRPSLRVHRTPVKLSRYNSLICMSACTCVVPRIDSLRQLNFYWGDQVGVVLQCGLGTWRWRGYY
jgi:hypothetical protein